LNQRIQQLKNSGLSAVPWLFLALFVFIISVVIAFSVIPRTLAAQVTMVVYQQSDGKVFGKETQLDIFQDPKLGGQKLVHPFSEGSYTFAVHNSAKSAPLPYSLEITGTNPEDIPLVFNLTKNGEYVHGGAGFANMVPFSELNFPELMLDGKRTDLYTIHWKWKTTSDEIDTAIGNIGTQTYTLVIKAVGSIPESAAPKTGDSAKLFVWFSLALASALLLFVLLFFKRRKEKRGDENG